MRNLMTLRGMRTLIAAAALAALSCGGGDPPGGGNRDTDGGDETDGTTGNGGTDGHVPNPNNPLIAVIPGTWEFAEVDGQPIPSEQRRSGPVTVDPNDPDCSNAEAPYLGPPGDACIDWIPNAEPTFFILDGDTVRAHLVGTTPRDGHVLDGGRYIEYNAQPDVNGKVHLLGFRKLD